MPMSARAWSRAASLEVAREAALRAGGASGLEPVSGAVTPPGNRLREADEARDEAIQVDAFDPETYRALKG